MGVKEVASEPFTDAARSSESEVLPESLGSLRACISTLQKHCRITR